MKILKRVIYIAIITAIYLLMYTSCVQAVTVKVTADTLNLREEASTSSEILTLLRENLIKTRSIKYEYDPQSDSFVRNVPSEYHVAKLDTEMIGTYKNFESFLKELYKHEHFLDISNIEIVPYQKDKKILLIKFQLKLYAQR